MTVIIISLPLQPSTQYIPFSFVQLDVSIPFCRLLICILIYGRL